MQQKQIPSYKNAIVTPCAIDKSNRTSYNYKGLSGCAYDENGKIILHSQRSEKNKNFINRDPQELKIEHTSITLQGNSVYLGHYTEDYGHFLLESLSRFSALKETPSFDNYIFQPFIGKPTELNLSYSPLAHSLKAFKIDPAKLYLMGDKNVRCDNLYVPQSAVSLKESISKDQIKVYHKIIHYCQSNVKQSDSFPSRIFISRKKLSRQRRPLENYEEIEAIFKNENFQIIHPELLDFDKQVLLFHNADFVAGMSGSGMHNSVFCKEGTNIISLGNLREPKVPNINQILCDQLAKVNSHFIPFKGEITNQLNGEFKFDSHFIKKCLNNFLNGKKSKVAELSNERKVICVLGMHRSGTSSLAGSIQCAGIFSGNISRKDQYQPSGNRENFKVVRINNTLLKLNNATWKTIPTEDIIWDKEIIQLKDDFVESMFRQDNIWMFKDPRTILTFDFWKENLSNLFLIGTFRDPMGVALSLYKRNKMPLLEGLKLWLAHNKKLLSIYKESPFPLVCFDSEKDDYQYQIRQIIDVITEQNEIELSIEKALEFFRERKPSVKIYVPWCEDETLKNLIAEINSVHAQLKSASLSKQLPVKKKNPKTIYYPIESKLSVLDKSKSINESDLDFYQFLSDQYVDLGAIDDAIKVLKKSYHEYNNATTLSNLNILRLEKGEFEVVVESTLENLNSENIKSYIEIIKKLIKEDKLNHAKSLGLKVFETLSIIDFYKIPFARLMHRLGYPNRALSLIQDYNKHEPLDLRAFDLSALITFRAKQYDKCKSICLEGIQKFSGEQTEKFYFFLAEMYRINKNFKAAIDNYSKALSLNGENIQTYIKLAKVYKFSGQFPKAKQVIQDGLLIDKEHKQLRALEKQIK